MTALWTALRDWFSRIEIKNAWPDDGHVRPFGSTPAAHYEVQTHPITGVPMGRHSGCSISGKPL